MTRYTCSRSRDQLTAAMMAMPPGGEHLLPVMEMVRDGGIGMLFVNQHGDAFRIPAAKPAIAIIGDDFDAAYGPEKFHMPSLRRAIRSCAAFAVVSSAPVKSVYAITALSAVLSRKNTMLIETRPDQELAWVKLIHKLSPGSPLILSTVEGGNA